MKKTDLNRERFRIPYSVPENYFDELEAKIHQKVRPDNSQIFRFEIKWALIPALTLIIFFLAIKPLIFNSSNSSQLLADLSTQEIITYLENTELSDDEIANLGDIDIILGDIELMNNLMIEPNEVENLMDFYDIDMTEFEEI